MRSLGRHPTDVARDGVWGVDRFVSEGDLLLDGALGGTAMSPCRPWSTLAWSFRAGTRTERLDIVTSARVSCACVWHPARRANRMEPSLGVQHGHIRRSDPHDADDRADGSIVALVSKVLIHCSPVCSICDQAFAPALVACYRRGEREDLESSNRVGHVVGLRIQHAPAMIMLSNTQQMRITQRRRRTGQPA
jgi:hypothetical protein